MRCLGIVINNISSTDVLPLGSRNPHRKSSPQSVLKLHCLSALKFQAFLIPYCYLHTFNYLLSLHYCSTLSPATFIQVNAMVSSWFSSSEPYAPVYKLVILKSFWNTQEEANLPSSTCHIGVLLGKPRSARDAPMGS